MVLDALLADASSSTSFEGILLNLGLPGVVIIALGWYARSTLKASDERYNSLLKSSEERAVRLEADNRRLYDLMGDQFVPALTKSNDIINQAIAIMLEIQRSEEKKAAVEEARRQFEGRTRSD